MQALHEKLRRVGLMVSVSASHVVGHGFAPLLGNTKDHNNKSFPARQQSSPVSLCVYIYQLLTFLTHKKQVN